MKLKYLLPVATIASVATVVTPLAVSCGKNSNFWDFKKAEYVSKFEPAKAKAVTTEEATQIYYDKLKDAPEIYRDDLFTHLNDNIFSADDVISINTATVKADISNVSLVEMTPPAKTEKAKMINATFNVEYNLDLVTETDIPDMNEEQKLTWSFTTEIKNFKMWAEWGNFGQGEEALCFRPVIYSVLDVESIKFLQNDKEWSLTANGTFDGEIVDVKNVNSENITQYTEQMEYIFNIVMLISPVSHYLSKLTKSK